MTQFKTYRYFIFCFLLASCGSPRSYLDKAIQDKNFIPFQLPMESTRVGTVLKGNDNEMYVVARPERCFPDLPGDQALRWLQPTELPNEYKKVELGFNAQANDALGGGNPIVNFKLSAHHVKTVEIEFEGATVEFLDEWAFENHWLNTMSDRCQEAVMEYAFIGQGLRVEKMRFVFKSETGAAIDLSAQLDNLIDIKAGVSWKIEKGYTLIIDTPKYIGYRMAKVVDTDGVLEIQYATKVTSSGDWIFKSFDRLKSLRAPSLPKMAEPLR